VSSSNMWQHSCSNMWQHSCSNMWQHSCSNMWQHSCSNMWQHSCSNMWQHSFFTPGKTWCRKSALVLARQANTVAHVFAKTCRGVPVCTGQERDFPKEMLWCTSLPGNTVPQRLVAWPCCSLLLGTFGLKRVPQYLDAEAHLLHLLPNRNIDLMNWFVF